MAQSRTRNSHPKDPPRKQVLLLTCMDLRLADDTTNFMNQFNLENRYDHLTLAGAAMGARLLKTPVDGCETQFAWKDLFFHHLKVAIDVLHRDIGDIFILEHLDCGAYKYLYPDPSIRKRYNEYSQKDMQRLIPIHRKEANLFAREITRYCAAQQSSASSELSAVRSRIGLQATCSEDDYQSVAALEARAEAWQGINVRSFVMDLKGCVERL